MKIYFYNDTLLKVCDFYGLNEYWQMIYRF